MKQQRFMEVTDAMLQKLNQDGWYVVQVIETNNARRLTCMEPRCFVLLEKKV